MAQSSGFFNAQLDSQGNFDRVYLAEQFANYFSNFIGNGVFAHLLDKFVVTAGSGLRVNVAPGKAFAKGFWFESDEIESLQIEIPDGVQNRKDNIVVRFDFQNRRAGLTVIKGTPSSNPEAPEVVRTQLIFDLKIAEVFVGASVSSISQSAITDTRSNSNVCGWVTGLIDQLSTSDLWTQWNAAYNDAIQNIQNDEERFESNMQAIQTNFESDLNQWFNLEKDAFDAWMETLTQELNVDGYMKEISKSILFENWLGNTINVSSFNVLKKPDDMKVVMNGLDIPTFIGTFDATTSQIDFVYPVPIISNLENRKLIFLLDNDEYIAGGDVHIRLYKMITSSTWKEVNLRLDKNNTPDKQGVVDVLLTQWTAGVRS